MKVASWVFCLSMSGLLSTPLSSQTAVRPLRGISAVTTRVSLDFGASVPVATGGPCWWDGVTWICPGTVTEPTLLPEGVTESRLRTLVELRLRTAGIRVLTDDENKKDRAINPYVALAITGFATQSKEGTPSGFAVMSAASVRISSRASNGASVPQELWSRADFRVSDPERAGQSIEQAVGRLMDDLITEWLAANPKRPATTMFAPVLPAYLTASTTASKNAQSSMPALSEGLERALHTTITTCSAGLTYTNCPKRPSAANARSR